MNVIWGGVSCFTLQGSGISSGRSEARSAGESSGPRRLGGSERRGLSGGATCLTLLCIMQVVFQSGE